ncbi:MAG: hypothetical protein SGI99_09160 [Pseudomonadota bacterium]|nr:hypothetical protein [Pseudomonadota bacterium]
MRRFTALDDLVSSTISRDFLNATAGFDVRSIALDVLDPVGELKRSMLSEYDRYAAQEAQEHLRQATFESSAIESARREMEEQLRLVTHAPAATAYAYNTIDAIPGWVTGILDDDAMRMAAGSAVLALPNTTDHTVREMERAIYGENSIRSVLDAMPDLAEQIPFKGVLGLGIDDEMREFSRQVLGAHSLEECSALAALRIAEQDRYAAIEAFEHQIDIERASTAWFTDASSTQDIMAALAMNDWSSIDTIAAEHASAVLANFEDIFSLKALAGSEAWSAIHLARSIVDEFLHAPSVFDGDDDDEESTPVGSSGEVIEAASEHQSVLGSLDDADARHRKLVTDTAIYAWDITRRIQKIARKLSYTLDVCELGDDPWKDVAIDAITIMRHRPQYAASLVLLFDRAKGAFLLIAAPRGATTGGAERFEDVDVDDVFSGLSDLLDEIRNSL